MSARFGNAGIFCRTARSGTVFRSPRCCRFEYFIVKLCIFERGIALSEIIPAVDKVFRHYTGYLAYFERDCFNILYLLFLGYLLDGISNIFYQGNSSGVSALLLYDMNILIQDRAIGNSSTTRSFCASLSRAYRMFSGSNTATHFRTAKSSS